MIGICWVSKRKETLDQWGQRMFFRLFGNHRELKVLIGVLKCGQRFDFNWFVECLLALKGIVLELGYIRICLVCHF